MECLESLVKQSYPEVRILVVDNGSSDGSPGVIASQFPQVEQIVNKENLGFARGVNLGIRHAIANGADYVFVTGNDTVLDQHCIANLLEHVSDDTGLLAPVIYYEGHPQVIWSLGGKLIPITLEKSSPWDHQLDPGNWPAALERDFVTGCAVLIPRQTIDKVGVFDDHFFMYYEDADYCLRVRQARLRISVIPSAKIWHKVAASSGGSDSPNERYWMARSSIRCFRKHANWNQVPIILFWRTGSALRTTFRLGGQRKWRALRAYWRGTLDGLRDLFRKD